MTILNRIASNWSFQEREKLNNNWTILENYLSNLQGQINLLTGDINVQELIDQINEILNRGNIVIEDLEAALQDASTVISNAQIATTNADNAAQDAQNAINNIQNIINNFGSKGVYDNSIVYSKNNIVYDDGCSYIYTNDNPSSGNPPPTYPTISNDYWHRLADKGASGNGSVSKVNGKVPNGEGEVILIPSDIGAANNTDFTQHLSETVDNGVHGMGKAAKQNYEDGVWTPTINRSNVTYLKQIGSYTRIGNRVFINAEISFSNVGTSSVGTLINGLPFARKGSVLHVIGVLVSNLVNFDKTIFGRISTNTGVDLLTDNGNSFLQPTHLQNSTVIILSGFYDI